MNLRSSIAVFCVVAFLGFLVWGLVKKGESGLVVGETVPVATLATLPAGGEGSIEDYRGKWLLLNVWASWCGPCRDESPALDSFERSNRKKIAVVGINAKDSTRDALAFMKKFEIRFPQLRDVGSTYVDGDLKVTGFPETFLIDPQGKLADHMPGAFANESQVKKFAQPALETKKPVAG